LIGVEREVGLQACEGEVEQEEGDEKFLNVLAQENTFELGRPTEDERNRFGGASFRRKGFGEDEESEDRVGEREGGGDQRGNAETVSTEQTAEGGS